MKQSSDFSQKVVEEFWHLMQTNDFFAAANCLSDDFELLWPQSGELVKGRDNFARINTAYPASGEWNFTINKAFSSGADVVTDVSATDGVVKGRVITFSTVCAGKIARQVEFWPDPFEAPAWREAWVTMAK